MIAALIAAMRRDLTAAWRSLNLARAALRTPGSRPSARTRRTGTLNEREERT